MSSTTKLDSQVREAIRLEYITRNASLRNLAERHGVGLEALREVAEAEEWERQRDEYWRSIYTDVIHATKAATANLLAGTVSAADKLVRWANRFMVVDKQTNEVILDPDDVDAVTKSIKAGLDVLKFGLGEPDNLVITSTVEPTAWNDKMEETAAALRKLLKGKNEEEDEE